MPKINLGQRLRELRERHGLSQRHLAFAADMDPSLLSKYERGLVDPGWAQLDRILAAVNASPCHLFSDLCVRVDEITFSTFTVTLMDRPDSDEGGLPTGDAVEVPYGTLVKLLGLIPQSDRYIISPAVGDWMVPDWYPGDLILIDKQLPPTVGAIAAGFYHHAPRIGRLTRIHNQLVLVASNLNYPPISLDLEDGSWNHLGCVIRSFRNLESFYVADEERPSEI